MSVIYDKARPYIKRIPTTVDATEGIQRFGVDNLYPQVVEEAIKRSYTLKSVVNRLTDFLTGEGFRDPVVAALKLNTVGLQGETANKVLARVARTFSKWESVVLHIQYNMNYRICSIVPIKFEYIRLGIQSRSGKVDRLAYSTNWERDSRRGDASVSGKPQCFYNRFNPDPSVVAAEIADAGGIEYYEGQLLYLTPEEDEYPLSTCDSVLDHAQAQAEAGIYKVSNVQNAFVALMAIVFPGEFESNDEKNDFNSLVASKKGGRGAGSTIGLQDRSGTKKASDIFQTLTPPDVDKLYEYTETSAAAAIMENEAMPKELLGVRPETGMFNQENMEQAYIYANSITRIRRERLSEVFSYLLSFWETPIQSACDIVELRYIKDDAAGTQGLQINDNIKNMSGMQAVNFERILRKYEQKKYTRAIATSLLQQGFGLSLEEINKILDGIDQLVAEEAAAAPATGQVALAFKQQNYEQKLSSTILQLAKTYL